MKESKHMTRWLGVLGFGLALGLGACSQNYQEAPAQEAAAQKGLQAVQGKAAPAQEYPNQRTAPAGAERSLGDLAANVPEGWVEEEPASSMRLAQYRLPGDGAGDAVLAVFHFGSNQGGSVDANIDRWYGQFSQPDGGDTKARSGSTDYCVVRCHCQSRFYFQRVLFAGRIGKSPGTAESSGC